MREIEKLAHEQFNGDIPSAIEYAYRTWGNTENERMKKIFDEFTKEEADIACQVIVKLAVERSGIKGVEKFTRMVKEAKRLIKELEMSDEQILKTEKNPFASEARKSVGIILLCLILPFVFAYLFDSFDAKLFGFELKNVMLALPVFLLTPVAIHFTPQIMKYFYFKRAKKLFSAMDSEEEMPKLPPRISILGSIFLIIAVATFIGGITEANKMMRYRKHGVELEAKCYRVDRIDNGDTTDYNGYLAYTYEGKEYTWYEEGASFREDDIVTVYIYPDKPSEVYIYEGSFFVSFFFMVIAAFFFWMENNWRRYWFSIFGVCHGTLMCIVGIIYKMNAWLGWGIFFVIFWLLMIALSRYRRVRQLRRGEYDF